MGRNGTVGSGAQNPRSGEGGDDALGVHHADHFVVQVGDVQIKRQGRKSHPREWRASTVWRGCYRRRCPTAGSGESGDRVVGRRNLANRMVARIGDVQIARGMESDSLGGNQPCGRSGSAITGGVRSSPVPATVWILPVLSILRTMLQRLSAK